MFQESAPVLRVGLIGLNRSGWHVWERSVASSLFAVVSACEASPAERRRAERLGIKTFDSERDFLTLSDVDVVWLAACDADAVLVAKQALSSGRVVVVDSLPAIATSCGSIDCWCDRSAKWIWSGHYSHETDFRRTLRMAQSDQLGRLKSARWSSWSYGIWPRGANAARADSLGRSLWTRTSHALDELLQLMPTRPARAFGHRSFVSSEIADDVESGIVLVIEFADGSVGQLDVRLDSSVSLQTGWLLCGETGGYANGRWYPVTSDGEVYEASVAEEPHSDDALTKLVSDLRSSNFDPLLTTRQAQVLRLLPAIRQAVESRTVIEL